MFDGYYGGKRVLLTGHTGFKGAWLALWLKQLGAEVCGVGLPAPTNPNLHEIIHGHAFARQVDCDIRNLAQLSEAIREFAPDLIFHLAAQPLVRRSYAEPLETLETNALGTANLLEAVRLMELPCAILVVTSDKCYENQGWEYGYRESDPLGGHDIYSMSKAATELVVQAWRKSFFQPNPKLGNLASARAGNVIGGGDYAADRIVPDCVRALLEGRAIEVRNPAATRPWQHVLDCLSGYLWLGARLGQSEKNSSFADAFNFGPGVQANQPVSELVKEILRHWPGEWRDTSNPSALHEARQLNLAIDKAAARLQWFPTWNFAEAVEHSVAWYHQRHARNNPDMLQLTLGQIESFTRAAQAKNLAWAKPATR